MTIECLITDKKKISYLKRIKELPLHPKNNQSLDNIVNQYVRSWLEIPIAVTFNTIGLSKVKCGIWHVIVSPRFSHCQTVIRYNFGKSLGIMT